MCLKNPLTLKVFFQKTHDEILLPTALGGSCFSFFLLAKKFIIEILVRTDRPEIGRREEKKTIYNPTDMYILFFQTEGPVHELFQPVLFI